MTHSLAKEAVLATTKTACCAVIGMAGGHFGMLLLGALGGAGAIAAGESTRELLKFASEKGSEIAAEIGLSVVSERQHGDPLERVFCDSLRQSLREIFNKARSSTSIGGPNSEIPGFDEWFENWDLALKFPLLDSFDNIPLGPDTADDAKYRLRECLALLNAQGAMLKGKSKQESTDRIITFKLDDLEKPSPSLIAALRSELPEILPPIFKENLTVARNDQANKLYVNKFIDNFIRNYGPTIDLIRTVLPKMAENTALLPQVAADAALLPQIAEDAAELRLSLRSLPAQPGRWARPGIDPFRKYLKWLHVRTVRYLSRAMFREIPLTMDYSGAASLDNRDEMFNLMFSPFHSEDTSSGTFLNFIDALSYGHGRIFLLGDPGAGKTISLLVATRDAIETRLADPTAPVPFFANIASLNPRDPADEPALPAALSDWIADGHSDLNKSDVQEALDNGNALLLLDGLDELRKRHSEFLSLIPASTQVVITSRTSFYVDLQPGKETFGGVLLNPLSDQQINDFLREQPKLLEFVHSKTDLLEAARNPFILTILAFTYRDSFTEVSTKLPSALADEYSERALFADYLSRRYCYEQKRKSGILPLSEEDLTYDLGWLACMSVNNGKVTFDLDYIRHAVTDRWNTADVHGARQWHVDPEVDGNVIVYHMDRPIEDRFRNLLELGTRIGVIVEAGEGAEGGYRFTHLLLRDALATRFCIENMHLWHSPLTPADDPYLMVGVNYTLFTSEEVLEELYTPDLLPVFLNTLVDSEAPLSVRCYICKFLRSLRDDRAIPFLIQAITSVTHVHDFRGGFSFAHLREWAIDALGELGDQRAVQFLVENLSRSGVLSYDGSRAAIRLGELRCELAVEPLLTLLDSTEHQHQLNEIVRALGAIGSRDAILGLTKKYEQMEEGDLDRISIVEALSRSIEPEARAILLNASQSTSERLRMTALRSLQDPRTD